MYKFFLNGKVYFVDNGRIYDLVSIQNYPELVARLAEPIPEIEAEEFQVYDGYLDCWNIIHNSKGTKVQHIYSRRNGNSTGGRPRLNLPEDKIMELHKQGLGSKAIATRLRNEGHKTSYKTIQRILSRGLSNHSGQKVEIRA